MNYFSNQVRLSKNMKVRFYLYVDKKDKAKQVPLVNLFDGDLTQIGKVLRGKCPFHDDNNHPNFFIYPDTNSWYCFAGCGGGDSIAYYMRLKNISFKEAVEELAK